MDGTPRPDALSGRENEVLALIVRGASNRQIADALCVSVATVKTHLTSVYRKLGVTSRYEAQARLVARADVSSPQP